MLYCLPKKNFAATVMHTEVAAERGSQDTTTIVKCKGY